MAKYDLRDPVEKRVRFFDGQFLQDQDFIDEQHYHVDRQRRHNRLLHVAGIADGLAVSASGANQVGVAPGTAVDSDGRQIVLAQTATVDLPAERFNDKQGITLAITYHESAEDQQTEAGSADYTRWLERPQLIVIGPGEAYAGATPPVTLAQLALDNKGTVTVDSSVREYSGLRLPSPAADAPTLRTAPSGRVGLAGSLTVDGNVGIGTTDPHAKLQVSGGKVQLDGGQQLLFTDTDTTNNLKLQLWAGYGLGINPSTLFYAANGRHSWRDNSGTNERMALTTAADGGLTVKGTGNSSFAGNLELAGELTFTGGHLKTRAIGRITPLYLRGTGFNNSSDRVLIVGSTTVYRAASGRGLTLTILKKTDHTVISTTTYDTYGTAANSDSLAAALNDITKEQIGVLTSFDAWESAVTDNLRAALRRVGLYKAAVLEQGLHRRPYAAIFEASSATTVNTGKAVEVLYGNDATAPFAEIRGWLMDGSFVATGSAPNVLTNNVGGRPAVLVNEDGNVGIGTISPTTKLEVDGDMKASTAVLSQLRIDDITIGQHELSVLRKLARPDTLRMGERLNPGEALSSRNGLYHLVMQHDGNLVEYEPVGKPVWASNTHGHPGTVLINRADGDLVLIAPNGTPLWDTKTFVGDTYGSILTVQDDRNVCVYAPPYRLLWQTKTAK